MIDYESCIYTFIHRNSYFQAYYVDARGLFNTMAPMSATFKKLYLNFMALKGVLPLRDGIRCNLRARDFEVDFKMNYRGKILHSFSDSGLDLPSLVEGVFSLTRFYDTTAKGACYRIHFKGVDLPSLMRTILNKIFLVDGYLMSSDSLNSCILITRLPSRPNYTRISNARHEDLFDFMASCKSEMKSLLDQRAAMENDILLVFQRIGFTLHRRIFFH